MTLPSSTSLSTDRLCHIFDNTTASYKFFWFLSIMQIHAKTGNLRISVWDLVISMVANSWYPIHYFKLSYGKSDSLSAIINNLQSITEIPIDASIEAVSEELKLYQDRPEVKKNLRILTNNVPYRFLMPWIRTQDNRDMVLRSQMLENGCLYALRKDGSDMYIEINEAWDQYLHKHYAILMDFAYWNLTLFLQNFNPNVPAIPNKLIRPEMRNSLSNQHTFWDAVMVLGGPIHCIYTGAELHPKAYDLDHFIPWSFVSHDLLWNLIPADSSINSSKSNNLPDLDIYLPKLALLQHGAIKTILKAGKNFKVLEDYISLGYSVQELAEMSDAKFCELYQRTFSPINQIALNMGFETWKY